jgi:hypothetical protein
LAWIAGAAVFVVWNGSAWEPAGVQLDVSDAIFSLMNAVDPTKRAIGLLCACCRNGRL